MTKQLTPEQKQFLLHLKTNWLAKDSQYSKRLDNIINQARYTEPDKQIIQVLIDSYKTDINIKHPLYEYLPDLQKWRLWYKGRIQGTYLTKVSAETYGYMLYLTDWLRDYLDK